MVPLLSSISLNRAGSARSSFLIMMGIGKQSHATIADSLEVWDSFARLGPEIAAPRREQP